jgi:hypothetical protein
MLSALLSASALPPPSLFVPNCAQDQSEQADNHLKKEIHDSITDFKNANEQLTITAEILAPVAANADAAKRIAGIQILFKYNNAPVSNH